MAERFEVLEIVDYNSALSWRFKQDEVNYWFRRFGVEETKKQMHDQLTRALEVAEAAFKEAEHGKP